MNGPTTQGGYERVSQENPELGASLVGPAPGETLQTSSSTPFMEVVAPASLPEGYEFDASFGNNQTVRVKVPVGGVEQGQKFSVPLPDQFDAMIQGISVPVGHWRDGLLNLFGYGACHPHCWSSFCCCTVAAGQIISRLRLTWTGGVGSVSETTGAFQVISGIALVFWIVFLIDYSIVIALDPNKSRSADEPYILPPEPWPTFALIFDFMLYGSFILLAILLYRIRSHVRSRYGIPAMDGGGGELEDCCCSLCCPCLVVGQMLRHTTDYGVYPATCCTETGIPPTAPSIV